MGIFDRFLINVSFSCRGLRQRIENICFARHPPATKRRKSLLLKETLRVGIACALRLREGYSSRTLRERQRPGGFLSCLDVHKRERCRAGRFPPGLSASREETSRSIRRWRTQTGAMPSREVSSRIIGIKRGNLPVDAPLPVVCVKTSAVLTSSVHFSGLPDF
jgi:hypothetical protein